MDGDLSHYDLFYVTTRHSRMADAELLGICRQAWERYYTPEHVETVLRRANESVRFRSSRRFGRRGRGDSCIAGGGGSWIR